MATAIEALTLVIRRPIDEARQYDRRKLRSDLVAAATVAVVAVPQVMAFALIAGVPPIYGLYGLIVQSVLGALLSSVTHLSTGPTNTVSLLVASVAAGLTNATGAEYVTIVIVLTLVSGLIQLAFAVGRMGSLVRYVSQAVILGFTAGAGVLIAAKQLPNFLGIELTDRAGHLPGLPGIVQQMGPHVTDVNGRAVLIGVVSLAVVIVARRISRFVPGPLLAVVAGAGMVRAMGWTVGDLPLVGDLRLVGELPSALLPSFQWPAVQIIEIDRMLGGALAIALIGMIEAVAIAKSIAQSSGTRVRPTQEFFAQGLVNTISSCFQCYPGTGSFSRSALNRMAGARTRFAGIYMSALVVVILFVFAPLARYVPLASLAAILFFVAYGLIDWRFFGRICRADPADATVCVATFLATLLIPLEYAVFVGIFLNIALYMRRAARLQMNEMVRTPAGPFQERPVHGRSGGQAIVFLQLEGDLFFGVADELSDRLGRLAQSGVRVVVLRLKRTHSIDTTVLNVLDQFARQMQGARGHVVLCGLQDELMRTIERFGLAAVIGQDNVFLTQFGVFSSAKAALVRARELMGRSIDIEPLAGELDEPHGWSYEI